MCIYICICICMYVYIYRYVCVYIHIFVCMYMYVYIHICITRINETRFSKQPRLSLVELPVLLPPTIAPIEASKRSVNTDSKH